MKIIILAISKKNDKMLTNAISDYSQRLRHYTKLEWNLVETKILPSFSEDEIRRAESELLLQALDPEDTIILLDEIGEQLQSPQLAKKLQSYMNRATRSLIFIIGGAYGVDERLKDRADFIWSLSELVFPHQLVRLILAEQLYRAHTILAGEKYHHQ